MRRLAGTLKTGSFLMFLFVRWHFVFFSSKRSTFSGTELDFLLKLARQTKNNPPLTRERQNDEGMKERGEVRDEWKEKLIKSIR